MIDYKLYADAFSEMAKLHLAIAVQNSRLGFSNAEKIESTIATSFFNRATEYQELADKEAENA